MNGKTVVSDALVCVLRILYAAGSVEMYLGFVGSLRCMKLH